MKITTAAASAVLFIFPVVLAAPAQADPGCQQVTGRLSVCPSQQPTPDPSAEPQDCLTEPESSLCQLGTQIGIPTPSICGTLPVCPAPEEPANIGPGIRG